MALVPLLVALHRQPVSRAWLLGLCTGIFYFGGTLYWITGVMAAYGGLALPVAVMVNVLLILYQSAYPTLFAAITARITTAGGTLALMAAPAVWVTTELGRTRLFSGFPWVLLGYSQTEVLPVAQLASLFGVYGVSALVAAVNAALAVCVLAKMRGARLPYVPAAAVAAMLVVSVVWGAARMHRGTLTATGQPVRVGLIQGNVSQDEKWDDRRAPRIFRNYLDMSRQAIDQGASFVLWPESSTPFPLADNLAGAEEVRSLARSRSVSILVGSDQVERGRPNRWFNAAFMIGADGNTKAVYRKMHLVPFGEYVPMRSILFFAGRLVEAVSDFSPGDTAVLLPVGDHLASTAICYEVVYPDLVRQFVAGGSQLLTTITNDAWFGPTSAPYQHFEQASMRAIENGRYLVRAANTGISGVVDPYGRVLARSRVFEPAVVVGDVRFVSDRTLYTRTGDVFAYACAVATLLQFLAVRRRIH